MKIIVKIVLIMIFVFINTKVLLSITLKTLYDEVSY